jgi:hypothetical protein
VKELGRISATASAGIGARDGALVNHFVNEVLVPS